VQVAQQGGGLVVGYVRVSSKAQNYATQRHAIEQCAGQRSDTITLWLEEKLSGKTLKRPVLDQLRTQVRLGTVRRIYTFKLDRLTRSGVADTFAVVQEMRDNGTELVCVADGYKFDDSPAADAVIFALSLGAKLERAAIADRIAAARVRVEAEGGSWGRPRSLDDEQVAKVLKLHEDGASLSEIASATGTPRSTVQRLLTKAG